MYFKQNGNAIEKYEVIFDRENIKELRNEVLEKCSIIKHKEYKTTRPDRIEDVYVKNLEYKVNETKHYHGAFDYYPDETSYLVKYDAYYPPALFNYLCEILRNEYKNLDKIFANVEEKMRDFDEEINKKYIELNNIDLENVDAKQKKLMEIKELLNEKSLNQNQVSTKEYYYKARKLIAFKLVDKINTDELLRIKEFFETLVEEKDISKLKKYIKN